MNVKKSLMIRTCTSRNRMGFLVILIREWSYQIQQTYCNIVYLQIYQILLNPQAMKGYSTPTHKQINQFSTAQKSTAARKSTYKRVPIFVGADRRSRRNSGLLASCCNRTTNQFYSQALTELQVINYDFCGCQNIITPCQIINQKFLQNVSVARIKILYQQEQKQQQTILNNKQLFSILPMDYPQVYVTHLSKLCQKLNINNTNQFQCLLSIQYHSKIQYLTYFLYKDMKSAYSNIQKFKTQVQYQLIKYNISLDKLVEAYEDKYLGSTLTRFITDYYESIGANLIPITHYSKFMAEIYQKSRKYIVRIIVKFMVTRKRQLQQGLMYLRCAQLERYRQFMRKLNFQELILQK